MDRTSFSPTEGNERIEALDVVRGFALIGICIMNVEYFNRAISDMGGIPAKFTGLDFVISFITQYFVTGKFWTIFSLLFGMGFAVMLTRANKAGRSFLVPYMRRIAALAVFGACHHIFIWSGDILFSYAVSAAGLLIVLFGRPKYIVTAIVLLLLVGFAPNMGVMAGLYSEKSAPDLGVLLGMAASLTFFSFIAWWLRGEQDVKKLDVPVVGLVILVAGILATIAGVAIWFMPQLPRPLRLSLPVIGIALTAVGILTCKFHEPKSERPWRLGAGMYVLAFTIMTGVGAMRYMLPEKPVAQASASAPATAAEAKAAKAKAERKAEVAKRLKERDEEVKKEIKVSTTGTYGEHLVLRANHFAENAPGELGFAPIVVGMFLLGYWFVRKGIMENTRAHLPLFRKLAMFGLPLGIGLGLLGAAICMYPVRGSDGADGGQLAMGLLMLGNLPACLGYVSLVILMLHSNSVFSKIRVLAPLGRMALTNYLTQSLVGAIYYFGWGFGHFGVSRAHQMAYVACLIVLQVAFSHFWLARFRYGPMEWLWRAITYWTIPRMALDKPTGVPAVAGGV
ncbi:DUF418 domain-containing protein [Pseudoduganella eburnea]|uniref:DUF418 domain-containing protein n=1 Tax=Massilia eburnea TaxID=1776165 RepID=A0A6L6QBL1_9BURK|nr:DUF418 domain-containing protein [Massilia eburnea]MTW09451.1 DUF418 domain-containing protein [Massilia eburnea]